MNKRLFVDKKKIDSILNLISKEKEANNFKSVKFVVSDEMICNA